MPTLVVFYDMWYLRRKWGGKEEVGWDTTFGLGDNSSWICWKTMENNAKQGGSGSWSEKEIYQVLNCIVGGIFYF